MGDSDDDTVSTGTGSTTHTEAGKSGKAGMLDAVKESRKHRRVRKEVRNVQDLLLRTFGKTKKRIVLRKAELAAIAASAGHPLEERDRLISLSRQDRTLDRIVSLLLLCARYRELRHHKGLRQFVREALMQHPVFATPGLASILGNATDGLTEFGAIEEILGRNFLALSWPEDLKQLTRSDAAECQANAVSVLLLWLYLYREASPDHIRSMLNSYLWIPATTETTSEAEIVAKLVAAREYAAIGIACSVPERVAELEARRAETAIREAQQKAAQVEEATVLLGSLEKRLQESAAKIKELEARLVETTTLRENERTHLIMENERIRGNLLGRVRQEIALLSEGLHALRRDPPKIHVMIDHAERAIDGLTQEMERLRGRIS
jgi:hypothetical protein